MHAAADAHETLLKLRNDAGVIKEQVVDAAAHISLLKSEEMQEDKFVYMFTSTHGAGGTAVGAGAGEAH